MKPKLLIIGALSHISRQLVKPLNQSYQLIGADLQKETKGFSFPGHFYPLNYTKRPLADIFREHKIEYILHLGRVRSTASVSKKFRYAQNVIGMRSILSYGYKMGVRNFVILSTHLVYGALKENHLYLNEEDSLKASVQSSDLCDLVEMDHEASEFMWRYRDTFTNILRPCHIVGPEIKSPIMQALKSKVSPTLVGFDPLMQFIHIEDLKEIIQLSLKKQKSGIFNITGEGPIPLSNALKVAGSKPLALPSFLFPLIFKKAGYRMPKHFLNILKYPIIIDDRLFQKTFKYRLQKNLTSSLSSLS